ncbi:hypothetical protein C1924_13195 [Stenotrophomonas sp. ESTM1D_MKCIP4_1]|uniref:hypothetical protein n=1 Tax=Stenotrophomonas sp. ESTM1D_MKCIP4_1 TaxID=2072414 RepID=UPI000D542D26|nr:hypothetical protein [Stenotrophomonas sp. ESTM1D_MKCIP4_1]AWH54070.1 hypothetical protein C1924_13195 [Stenotrophomonas sp. ESTM1D_MKCIP4_1]
MNRPALLASLLVPLLLGTGCAHRVATAPPPVPGYIGSIEAVRAAQDDPARGISGIFAMTVQAVGSDDGRLYLNSERDYRHPLNITLNMDAALRPELEAALGLKLDHLQNRRLLVRGTARQTRIDFINGNGQRSGKYYYQTQISVSDPRQIRFAP